MAVEATLKQIQGGMNAINLLLAVKRDQHGPGLPAKASYSVGKLASACQAEVERFSKARDKIFEDGGCKREVVKGADGKALVGPSGEEITKWVHPEGESSDAMKALIAEVDSLMDAKVELNALPLDLDQFNDVGLAGAAFFGLDWAVKQPA